MRSESGRDKGKLQPTRITLQQVLVDQNQRAVDSLQLFKSQVAQLQQSKSPMTANQMVRINGKFNLFLKEGLIHQFRRDLLLIEDKQKHGDAYFISMLDGATGLECIERLNKIIASLNMLRGTVESVTTSIHLDVTKQIAQLVEQQLKSLTKKERVPLSLISPIEMIDYLIEMHESQMRYLVNQFSEKKLPTEVAERTESIIGFIPFEEDNTGDLLHLTRYEVLPSDLAQMVFCYKGFDAEFQSLFAEIEKNIELRLYVHGQKEPFMVGSGKEKIPLEMVAKRFMKEFESIHEKVVRIKLYICSVDTAPSSKIRAMRFRKLLQQDGGMFPHADFVYFNVAVSAKNTGKRALLSSSFAGERMRGRDVFFPVETFEHTLPCSNAEFNPRLSGGFIGYNELLSDAVGEAQPARESTPLQAHSLLADPIDQITGRDDDLPDVKPKANDSGFRPE